MRLGPFDSGDIDVRSSGGGGGRMGRAGGIGCGTLVIALIGAVVFGLDPMQTIGMVESVQQQGAPAGAGGSSSDMSEDEVCASSPYATEACGALASLNATWAATFDRNRIGFERPVLDLYRNGQVSTEGCGSASSAVGPFYCPADKGIYIDTSFYDQMARQMGAGGDFARRYVMAHEYGHHIQYMTGIAEQVRSAQQSDARSANQLQVRMELQADCYAGVWGHHAGAMNQLEPGDVAEALAAATAIGDDRLQKKTEGRVVPESFTHGSSEQRVRWFKRGLDSGRPKDCDTRGAL